MRGWMKPIVLGLALALPLTGCTTPAPEDLGNTAILVIDNFQPVPQRSSDRTAGANCAYSPEDVNVVGDQGAGDELPDGVSHGDAVYSLLTRQLDDAPGLSRRTTPRARKEYGLDGKNTGEITTWNYRGREMVLVALDHNQSTTGEIAGRIREVTDAMQASDARIQRFVLNMSFVIAPCNVPQWLQDTGQFNAEQLIAYYQSILRAHPGLTRFQKALDELVRDSGRDDRLLRQDPDDALETLWRRTAVSSFYESVGRSNESQLRERISNDPLKDVVQNDMNTEQRQVIPVAAAGNGVLTLTDTSPRPMRVRFDFPFAPGLWDSVVSVSASEKNAGGRAPYSNSAEVIMDGRHTMGAAALQGTSFAAPRLAVRQALYLLTGGRANCQGNRPALGYTNSDLPSQLWRDLPLNTAVAGHCADFTIRVTQADASPGKS
jgi:hypothetical protein